MIKTDDWGVKALIQAVDISKGYGREPVLDRVDLAVSQGEISCVIGPNGSGKSTLLNIMAGLLRPDGGRVLYRGQPPQSASIGFVPQRDGLFSDLSVRDNLAFWAGAAKADLKELLAGSLFQGLELTGMLRKRVDRLSGGMRRRVAVAAALVGEPELLILDEPFAGLDLFFKSQLTRQLQGLREAGVTILYTSHNADEIAPLSDTVHLLAGGKLVLHSPVGDLPGDQAALSQYLLKLIRGENRI